jgi:hypothetical protein
MLFTPVFFHFFPLLNICHSGCLLFVILLAVLLEITCHSYSVFWVRYWTPRHESLTTEAEPRPEGQSEELVQMLKRDRNSFIFGVARCWSPYCHLVEKLRS